MHYMRARRHGSADVVKKPGRPPIESRSMLKGFMRSCGWSPRTFDRYYLATLLLAMSEVDEEQRIQAIKTATRPSGSINVVKFVNIASMLYAQTLQKRQSGDAQ